MNIKVEVNLNKSVYNYNCLIYIYLTNNPVNLIGKSLKESEKQKKRTKKCIRPEVRGCKGSGASPPILLKWVCNGKFAPAHPFKQVAWYNPLLKNCYHFV